MESERIKFHSFGQPRRDAGGEVGEHVLARRLVIDAHNPFEPRAERFRKRLAGRRAAHDEGVVEPLHHLFADDPFELPEIHDHAQLGIPSVADRNASHGHEQPVRMAVYFAARTVVTFEQVRRLEPRTPW